MIDAKCRTNSQTLSSQYQMQLISVDEKRPCGCPATGPRHRL